MNFFYPPQPIRLWPNSSFFKGQLNSDPNFTAEIKYNGWRLEIHTDPKALIFYNRHGTIINIDSKLFEHKFKNIPTESVFDGELVNFRTKDVKNIIVLWDCMFWGGRDLRKLPLSERRSYLASWQKAPKQLETKTMGQVYRIRECKRDLVKFYDVVMSRNDPLEEGIVIKDKKSLYEFSIKSKIETASWYKIKKPGDHTLVEDK